MWAKGEPPALGAGHQVSSILTTPTSFKGHYMKWVLIAALWNTNPPQESFKFYTQPFATKQDCEVAAQELYAAAFNNGVQAQAICRSREQLGLGPVY